MGYPENKTKAVALSNHKRYKQTSELIKTNQANSCSRLKSRENVCERFVIGSDFTFDWMTKGANSVKRQKR